MRFFTPFVALSLLSPVLGAVLNATRPQALAVPFGGGSASIVQNPNGNTRIYHQAADGNIWEVGASGPFVRPAFEGQDLLIPASEVLPGTPIVATSVDGNFADIHVFFFSREMVVSEYFWTGGVGWFGGPNCTQCLTAQGFTAASTYYLYAAENNAAGAASTLRVGFSSAGAPGSLTEANKVGGVWQLGVMS
ncbi:hypothetical protein FB451DRAFT_1368566 [Mycena latifolia]|nr:hypothetical protein FB451DRAFT_1368566 [Mycena latifolia]